jgi:translation initiation factor 2B subunit (eIF-2B alpha/beta/delta family)
MNGDGRLDRKNDFVPSPEEAMHLLSAVWLHDIGMWYGILDNEQPTDLQDAARVVKLREEHEIRASRHIYDKWSQRNCSWLPEEKDWLANIIVYHRNRYDMTGFQPVKERARRITAPQARLRLGVLAALLRLADACHVDKRRAPQRVMRLYISLGMPAEARGHWERADLIKDVRFDHNARKIELTGHYPRKFDFGLGKFVVQEVGEMICDNVGEELRSVQQTLSPFSNTDFRDVRHIPHEIQAHIYQQRCQCLHLWPYLLSKPFSATEAAAALAQMLLLSAGQAEEAGDLGAAWREEMRQIMEKTKNLRPHDFMIRNLCIHVEGLLSELPHGAEAVRRLTECLELCMRSIQENCGKLVGRAQKLIGNSDVLVLYGHSANIDRLLRHVDTSHSIYIVDCYRPLDGRQLCGENEKILQTVKSLNFAKYRFLQFASLAGALDEVERKNIPCKLLLGTHGRLKGGDLLCKVGSRMIAEAAKRFGAKVIALCETTKFLINGVEDDDIAGPEQLFSSEDDKMHPELPGVPYVAPKMDRVPKELVDIVVTEKKVERPKKGARQGRRRTKIKAKGNKVKKVK